MALIQVFFVVAVLLGDPTPSLHGRPQCAGSRSLLLLIDSSRSMTNYGILDKLQLALKALVPSLDETLRLSIINFDDAPHVTLEEVLMDDAGKLAATDTLQTLTAGNGSKLETALAVVAKRIKSPSPCKQILLITDGTLSEGAASLQSQVEALHARGPVLSALLISASRDYATLKALVHAGGGELSQVRSADQILGGLKGMLRRMGALA